MTGPDNGARITPVILCGGAGARLWPLSRQGRPKQMLTLTGSESMLRQTMGRVSAADLYAPPLVVGAAAQADAIAAETSPGTCLILEPAARNTAPAIALAALNVDPATVLLVLPSDHAIADEAGFNEAVRRARGLAEAGWIVTFGMKPGRPETGFGYIKRGRALGDGLHEAERFVEKPDLETATAYLADGSYDWNGGIFLMRADTVLEGLARHAPDILAQVRAAVAGQTTEGNRISPNPAAFVAAPAVSIDCALMEKAEKVAVAPVSIGWSDIGSWAAVHDISDRDAEGNRVAGDAIVFDSNNCLVRSDGPLVAVIGVDNLIVVATGDVVLVVPKDQSQRVKEIVDRLKAEERESLI